jgi:NTP pyrophosphatase (non-canonical NTP hydrolase)
MDEVREFNEENDMEIAPELRMLDLISEIGELSKEILVAREYGDAEYEPTDAVEDEFGDLYYCVLSLAEELGVDPDDALDRALSKYRQRLADSEDAGSGE